MKFKHVVIEAIDYLGPLEFVTSENLEEQLSPIYERLKLPYGRLELQTGIKSRGIWPLGTRPSLIASMAAQKIFDVKKVKKENIDLLIHSSVCRDFLEPATASVIHNQLELKESCQCFDLSNACLGFMNAMIMASSMIEQGHIKSALIVTGENSAPLLSETTSFLNQSNITRKEFKKFMANLTIGSAGVAMVLSHSDHAKGPRLLGATGLCDTSAVELCQGDGNTQQLMMQTDSPTLLQAGVNLAHRTWMKMLEDLQLNKNEFRHIITHQVGKAHQELLYKTLELDLDRDISSYEKYGNTGSAALPLTLALANESKLIGDNEKMALLGIGSGLHSIMMGVEWKTF